MLVNRSDYAEAEKIYTIFQEMSEESKMMAIVYASALRDKEIADKSRQLQEVG